jgi:hypothetical protein
VSDDPEDWGVEEGNAREVSGFVLTLTEAVLNVESGRAPRETERETIGVMLDGIEKARRINAAYVASGVATPRFRKLVNEAEKAFQRIEQWAALRRERFS